MSCNKLFVIPNITLQLIRWKSSTNATRQSKILGKLFGNRMSGSKKRWYPSNDLNTNTKYQTPSIIFGPSSSSSASASSQLESNSGGGKNNAPGAKHTIRRMSVLNKLFMTHITDLLATGDGSEMILGRGLQVSRVKISNNFTCINVYWQGNGVAANDLELEMELQRRTGQLRHELSQLRLMGEVPKIKFVRDKKGCNVNQVENVLRNLHINSNDSDRDGDGASNNNNSDAYDVAQTVRQELYGNAAIPDIDPNSNNSDGFPVMRHDVFGLDRGLIMNKILSKMRKSQEAWEQHTTNTQQRKTNSIDSTSNTNANANTTELLAAQIEQKMISANESSEKFQSYLAQRRYERKQTPERKKNRREDWQIAELDSSGFNEEEIQQQQQQQDDYIVEDDATQKGLR